MSNGDLIELTYAERTWPLIRRRLTVTAAERRIVCRSTDESGHVTEGDHRCSEAEWQKLKDLFAACRFDAWQRRYETPALDGTLWELTIRLADGRTIESEGLNGWPDEWASFAALGNYCAELSAPAD